MISKVNHWYQKAAISAFLILVFAGILWQRNTIASYILLFLNFGSDEQPKMTLSEKEELERLRVENKILQNRLEELRFEVNLVEDGLKPTYVQLLGNNLINQTGGSFYGSFYVTYPKGKTAYKGMNIYAAGNVVVGTVEEVYKHSLFVSRLGQTKSFLAESARSKEQIELSALGHGLYTGNIVAGSKIVVGDMIVLRGTSKAVVGFVSEIQKVDNAPSVITVRAPYDLLRKQIFYVLQ